MAGITAALLIGTAISAAGSVTSDVIKAKAAGKAAKGQQEAAGQVSRRMEELYAPYMAMGPSAVASMGDMMGTDFKHFSYGGPSGAPAGGGTAAPRGMQALGFSGTGSHVPAPVQSNGGGTPNGPQGPPTPQMPPGQSFGDMMSTAPNTASSY